LAGFALAGENKKEKIMESKPDTIKISASHKEETFATHADLHVTIKRDGEEAKEVNPTRRSSDQF
jgi:uncharacterized protein YggE